MVHPLIRDLITEIETFCAAAGISPTAFGRLAMADPSFVGDLRRGRRPQLESIDRARAYITANSSNSKAVSEG